MKHVVIVGAGFAGMRLARKLSKNKHTRVTLINETPQFRYYPALYRAAVGENMSVSVLPLDWMMLGLKNIQLVVGYAEHIDPIHKIVYLEDATQIAYDELVLAPGSVTTFFNIEGLHERAYGIKSADEIVELRRHILMMMQHEEKPEQNYVIVGGGPTGVELAASFGTYIRRLEKSYKIKHHNVRVWLVEGTDRILPTLRPRSSALAKRRLKQVRVKVLTGTKVTAENARGLDTSYGLIKTHTVIWTAGTSPSPLFAANAEHFKRNERGRIVVNHHLQTHPSVYVIGDNAAVQFAGLAFSAVRHADFVAKDIQRRRSSGKRKNFSVTVPPVVIPLGKRFALFEYRRFTYAGRPVALVRSIADLVGYTDVMGLLKALSIWINTR